MKGIENNRPTRKEFDLKPEDAVHFTDLAWRELGRDIANHDKLERLGLSHCRIHDAKASIFFRNLLRAGSPKSLTKISLSHNNIRTIPLLEKYTNLESLSLARNEIGIEGCRSIAQLLQKDESRLKVLDISCNNLGDNEVVMLATSLKCNTSLRQLDLRGNTIKEEGLRALLQLLNDVSSIDNAYNSSNHSLVLGLRYHVQRTLPAPTDTQIIKSLLKHVNHATNINRRHRGRSEIGRSHEAGRAKVIETQLNSDTRMELCNLQGINFSYSGIFEEIDPILLPDVLAMVGRGRGLKHLHELYRMLITTVPDLVSIVNKRVAIQERIAKNRARIANLTADYQRQQAALTAEYTSRAGALTAKNFELERELVSIESQGGGEQARVLDATSSSVAMSPSTKRGRNAL